MGKIIAIAGNTFREVIRDRVLYIIAFFAAALIGLSKALGWISIDHDLKVIADFSLAGIDGFALLVTVFLGTTLVYKEVEKRTLYSVLAKDIVRPQFVLGKYLGLFGTAVLCVAGMGAIFFVYLLVMGGRPTAAMALALYGIVLELMLITSISLLLSSLASPVLSAIITFALYLTGHSMEVLRKFIVELEYGGKTGDWFLTFAYNVLPNLENFNFKNYVSGAALPDAGFVLFSTLYALVYSCVLLAVTLAVYQTKDF
jgi:ABC-type transport system involved in multi-copper enzyme maturation permease subunit